MIRVLGLIVLFGCTAAAQIAAEQASITIPKVSRPPKLDEFISHTPREAEMKVTDFRQFMPGDGKPVSQPTTAFLSYDDKNLYVAFEARDDPKLIRASMAKRKQILSDDRVTINIDTFHDHRHAYWFDVNPYGIQFDGITTDGYGDDFSWEGLWYTDAKITADGYYVLITIPFKTLRFPDADQQRWGITLARFIMRDNEFSMWPFITQRKMPQFVAQFGHMDGMENISPGRNLQFIPYGMGLTSRYLREPEAGIPGRVRESTGRVGLDAKAVIKDALTLDLTVNPDFSQVESDEPQVTVNQRFEVFFPERRPFFMENASYFDMPEQLFFSRRIADPEFGARMTGKIGRWGIGVLASDDRAPGRLADPQSPGYGERASNAVLSLQRDFLKDSHVRLFVTDREWASSHNRVAALDARLHFKNDFFLTAQATKSDTLDFAGRSLNGSGYYAMLTRRNRKYQYFSRYRDRSPELRADLGYVPRTDIREVKHGFGYKWWRESGKVVNFGPTLVVSHNWNRAGQLQDWQTDLGWQTQLKRTTLLTLTRTEAYELYDRLGFRKSSNLISFSTEWLRSLSAYAQFNKGDAVNYYPAAGLHPFAGRGTDASAGVTVRPTIRLRLDETYLYSRLRGDSASVYTNHIARSKVNYQFNRELSLRAIIDYNAVLPNSTLVSLNRDKRFSYDILLTYLLHPGTALHLGYTDIYKNLLFDPSRPPYLTIAGRPDFNTGRQIFVKFSYLFRY